MTVLNFPPTNSQPSDGSFTYTANGVVYTWDGEKWTANTAGSGGMGTVHFTGDSPPPAGEATETDQWFNTNDGRLYTYTKNENGVLVWVDASPDSDTSLWERTGTTLEPTNDGDDVDLGTGDLSAAAGTFRVDHSTVYDPTAQTKTDGALNVQNLSNTLNSYTGVRFVTSTTGNNGAAGIYTSVENTNGDANLTFCVRKNADGENERARITSDGDFLIGGTLPASPNIVLNASGTAFFKVNQQQSTELIDFTRTGSGTSGRAFVTIGGGTTAGSSVASGIQFKSGTTVTGTVFYNGTISGGSDSRLKQDLVEIDDGLNKVSKINGYVGSYKGSPETRMPFLIAQELQEVLPEAVNDSDPESLQVFYAQVIPLLVSALHDAKDRIEDLEAKVQQLEGGTN